MMLSVDAGPKRQPSAWRAFTVATAVVLAAHAWVLKSTPGQFSPAADPIATTALVTRSIQPPPAAAPPAPAVAVAPALLTGPKPAAKPVFKPNQPPAQSIRAEAAPKLIAQPPLEAGNQPSAPADADATAEVRGAQAATAAASAASAAAAPVPEPAAPALPQTTAVTAMALPASAQVNYKMTGQSKGLTYHAAAELVWRTSGGNYDAQMTVSAFLIGSRSLASIGKVSADGLAPTRFADKSRSEVAAHFEPEKGLITFSANTPSAPWIRGAQDRVTVFLQLGGMLAGNPAAFPAGSSIALYTVGPRSAEVWTFIVGSPDTISLPAGDMAALKLTRKSRGEYDQMLEIWLAPSLGYLPVRSKITQSNGDFVDQQMTELKSL